MSAEYRNNKDAAIYVVEFEVKIRAEITLALSGLPWPVFNYATPQDLMARLPLLQRGCVVANLEEVEISIAELLQKLAANRYQLPLILLTNDIEIPEAVAAIRAGAHDLQPLPIVERALRRQVRAAIEDSASRR